MDWISVTDSLPAKDQMVLICCKNNDMFVAKYIVHDYKYCTVPYNEFVIYGSKGRAMHGRKPLYWMPVPESPLKKKESAD